MPVAALPCGEAVAYVERVANTVAAASELSDAVITANIVSISGGRWATADGTRPYIEWLGKPWLRLPITEQVYSIMVARITGVGKESLADASIAAGQLLSVRVFGGTIGCRMFKFSDDLQYAVGDDVVLFLGQQPALADAPAGDFDAIDVWPIVNGVVEGRDEPMSPAELLAASDTTNP